MNPDDILRLSMTAGEIMLQNGAETYRVEDTMKRIQSVCGQESDAFVTTTGIFASVGISAAMIRRVRARTFNLEKIALVNELSRNIVNGKVSIEDAAARLSEIRDLSPYPLMLRVLFSGLACFSFCYMYGGDIMDSVAAFVAGLVVYYFYSLFNAAQVSGFLANILCGGIISLLAVVSVSVGLGSHIDRIIIGSIMPLVPGVMLTNAVRDILEGDFLSGGSRIMDAIFVAIAIATGVGAVLKLWMLLS